MKKISLSEKDQSLALTCHDGYSSSQPLVQLHELLFSVQLIHADCKGSGSMSCTWESFHMTCSDVVLDHRTGLRTGSTVAVITIDKTEGEYE
jgi:hypothetical protein